MLNKLKKILQWFRFSCAFILSGLIYVGEYTVPAIVLMVLAGVIVLPPVTKKIPAFKFRKAILIITSMVLLSAGMITGENNLSPEVQAKRAAAAEAAASSIISSILMTTEPSGKFLPATIITPPILIRSSIWTATRSRLPAS